MTTTKRDSNQTGTAGPRTIALLFLVSAICFFPMIMNPLIFGFFDAESDAERLEHAESHLGGLRLVFTGIGITELVLGVGLWLWGRRVAGRTSGRRGDAANAMAWVALIAGILALIKRLSAWIDDAEELASDDLSVADIAFGLISGGGTSLAFIVFGYLMIRGVMPTWLGVVWILCGIMFWVGILPLWFFVGALVFGIRGLIKFKSGNTSLDQVSAAPSV
jgi:hypothetical protein